MLWQTPMQSIPELAWSFRNTWTGRVLLAPFEVFSHAILADDYFPDLVCWGAAAPAIDLGLLVLVLKLDADYLEGAAAISQKLYERMQRAKQGGGARAADLESRGAVAHPAAPLAGRGRAAGVAANAAGHAHVPAVHLDLPGHRRACCSSMALFIPTEPKRSTIAHPLDGHRVHRST